MKILRLKERILEKSDERYPSSTLLNFAEKQLTIFHNKIILDVLEGVRYEVCGIDKTLENCEYPLIVIKSVQNRTQAETGGLAKLL